MRKITKMTGFGLTAGLALTLSACATGSGGDQARPTQSLSSTAQEDVMTTPANADATARLIAASAAGDLAAATKAIADGADLESRDRDGRTPLVAATKANHVQVARVLLEAGADPDAKDAIQDSAFLYAGAEGLNDILRLTLAHGADVKSTNRFGGTALIPASEHAHVETVKILIAAGVPVNHVNNLGWTALLEAIVLGNGDADHVTTVQLLLDAGADPGIRDRDGKLPRELAAAAGHDAIVAVIDNHR
ncbi:MAG: hypothetical protein HOV79_23230 [Hamadaea sp.]|nr:hypothetical protein [Hamadaea sp.]